MKQLIAFGLAAILLVMSAAAFCEPAQPEVRERVISIEGMDETIVETSYVSANGFQLWYPADLLTVSEVDGQTHFQLSEPVETLPDAGLIIVPADVPVDEADALLQEVRDSYGSDVQVSEIAAWTNESGVVIQTFEAWQSDRADRFYLAVGNDAVYCLTATYLPEMTEGIGARLEAMVRTLEITGAAESATPEEETSRNIVEGDFTGFADSTTVEVLVEDGYKSYKVFADDVKAYLESIDTGSTPIRFEVETVNGMETIVAVPVD